MWCGLSSCSCLCGAASVPDSAMWSGLSPCLCCVWFIEGCNLFTVKGLCVNWGKADLFTVTAMFLCGCSGWLLSFFVATYSFLWLHLDWNICVIAGWIPWPHFCWVLAVIIFTKGCRDSSIAATSYLYLRYLFQLLCVEPWSSLLWQRVTLSLVKPDLKVSLDKVWFLRVWNCDDYPLNLLTWWQENSFYHWHKRSCVDPWTEPLTEHNFQDLFLLWLLSYLQG
jgi:hypothetical protein